MPTGTTIGFPKKLPFPIDQSCVLYLKFNESSGNIKDWSGRGNTGIVYGTPTYGTTGKFGTALSFDGTAGNYVKSTLSTTLSSQEVTGCAWILVNSCAEKDGILSGSGYSFHMWINPSGDFNFGAWTSYTNEEYTSTKTYSFGVWRHVCVVNKGANYTRLYVDGVLDREVAIIGNLGTNYFEIGRHPSYNGNYLNGKVDEIRVYNRALSSQEIKRHYMAGR